MLKFHIPKPVGTLYLNKNVSNNSINWIKKYKLSSGEGQKSCSIQLSDPLPKFAVAAISIRPVLRQRKVDLVYSA